MIHKTALLECSPERAFTLFTQHASQWWPPDRRHTGDPHSTIEMSADGRFVERGATGDPVDLGRITRWSPPSRLEVDFYVASGAQKPTLLVVTFAPEGQATRITIDHGPGPNSQEVWNTRATAYEASWTLLLGALEHYALAHA